MSRFDEEPDGDIHGECAHEINRLEAELQHWKSNHADVVARLAIATQRPDLPVDRIPAIKALERLQSERYESERAWREELNRAIKHQNRAIELTAERDKLQSDLQRLMRECGEAGASVNIRNLIAEIEGRD